MSLSWNATLTGLGFANPAGAQRPSLLVAVVHAALLTSGDAVDASDARKGPGSTPGITTPDC
jgi:hypothetical protein